MLINIILARFRTRKSVTTKFINKIRHKTKVDPFDYRNGAIVWYCHTHEIDKREADWLDFFPQTGYIYQCEKISRRV
jgi:hypothetical protein